VIPPKLRSAFGVWLLLVAVTLISTLAAERHMAPALIIVVVFGFAAFKAHMVVMHYMEAKHAAPHWRRLYQAWLGMAAVVLIAGHLVAG
jgi:hypothetical protein